MRLASKSMTDSEDLDLVSCARIKIFQNDVRFRSQSSCALTGVISVMSYFELLLSGIHVALPRNVQALLDGLQILNYRTGRTCRLIQDGFV